jgi:hypothetical protein
MRHGEWKRLCHQNVLIGLLIKQGKNLRLCHGRRVVKPGFVAAIEVCHLIFCACLGRLGQKIDFDNRLQRRRKVFRRAQSNFNRLGELNSPGFISTSNSLVFPVKAGCSKRNQFRAQAGYFHCFASLSSVVKVALA